MKQQNHQNYNSAAECWTDALPPVNCENVRNVSLPDIRFLREWFVKEACYAQM
jgi:hypothetical protein